MVFSVKGLIAVCVLSGFTGLPNTIKAPVILKTNKFYVLKLVNKTKTQTIEITVEKNKCKVL